MKYLLSTLIILLTSVAFYFRSWKYGFVSDDIPIAKSATPSAKTKWGRFWHELTGQKNYYNKRMHLIVWTAHTLVCFAIYFAFGHNLTSLLASLFFCLNAVNLYNSVWSGGKSYTLGALCSIFLVSFPYLSPLFYAIGLTQSNNILFAPLVFLLTPYPFMASIIFMSFFRVSFIFNEHHHKYSQESNNELLAIKPRKLVTYFKTFGYYWWLCLFPHKIGLYHDFLYNLGVDEESNKQCYKKDMYFVWGIFTFLLSFFLIFTGPKIVAFGLFWFILNISMWCNFVTMQQQIASRYVYLSNIGMMVALAGMVVQCLYPYNLVITIAILVFYATRLWWFMPSLYNEFWNVEYNVLESKNLHYAWVSKAVHCFNDHHLTMAHMCLLRAKELRPKDFKTNFNLAQILLLLGDAKSALTTFDYAMKECTVDGREPQIKILAEQQRPIYEEIAKQIAEKGTATIEGKNIRFLL